MHRFRRERPADWEPLSIALTEGLHDQYTPPRGIEAFACRPVPAEESP